MEVSVQVQAEKSTRWRSREHEVEKMGLTWSQLGKTRGVGGASNINDLSPDIRPN